ncbi:hypothetical protein HYU13_02100 [Candidatus Woesearchaeota archaeon]|nr:hypothetical protein [Candidatus Woesearchaeota archaeon]
MVDVHDGREWEKVNKSVGYSLALIRVFGESPDITLAYEAIPGGVSCSAGQGRALAGPVN